MKPKRKRLAPIPISDQRKKSREKMKVFNNLDNNLRLNKKTIEPFTQEQIDKIEEARIKIMRKWFGPRGDEMIIYRRYV